MRDSMVKEPGIIYVITQPFCCCITYETRFRPVIYVLLPSYCIQQTIKRNESLERM